MTSQQPNYSFHYIAAAYTFSYLPHSYSLLKLMSAKDSKVTNTDTTKSIMPPADWTKVVRARSCHLNALEGFPLFAAAMIAAKIAKIPSREVNVLGAEYLGVRLLYSILYMTARNESTSYLRNGVYAWSVGIPFYLLVQGWWSAQLLSVMFKGERGHVE